LLAAGIGRAAADAVGGFQANWAGVTVPPAGGLVAGLLAVAAGFEAGFAPVAGLAVDVVAFLGIPLSVDILSSFLLMNNYRTKR